jgi:hypothetical protein
MLGVLPSCPDSVPVGCGAMLTNAEAATPTGVRYPQEFKANRTPRRPLARRITTVLAQPSARTPLNSKGPLLFIGQTAWKSSPVA